VHLLGGLFFLSVGLYGTVRPTSLARLSERADAAMSSGSADGTDPAPAAVKLTRVASALTALVGAGVLALAGAGAYG
jgi:hypothetical protein